MKQINISSNIKEPNGYSEVCLVILSIALDILILKGLFNIIISIYFIAGLFSNFTNNLLRVNTANILLYVISVVIVVCYYAILSKKTSWLSLGEKIAGRYYKNNKKVYENPYVVNRTLLFVIMILAILMEQGEIDGFSFQNKEIAIYNLGLLLNISLRFIAQIIGICLAGRGRPIGLIISILLYLNYFRIMISFRMFLTTAIIYLFLAIIYIVIGIYYQRKRRN